MKDKIIIIGRSDPSQDDITILKFLEWLKENRGIDVIDRFFNGQVDEYDMTTHPERGDAIDHIDEDTLLVIALHLFGINMHPMVNPVVFEKIADMILGDAKGYGYNRKNGSILKRCMEVGAILAAWGDQPWYGKQKATKIHENSMWVYERENGR